MDRSKIVRMAWMTCGWSCRKVKLQSLCGSRYQWGGLTHVIVTLVLQKISSFSKSDFTKFVGIVVKCSFDVNCFIRVSTHMEKSGNLEYFIVCLPCLEMAWMFKKHTQKHWIWYKRLGKCYNIYATCLHTKRTWVKAFNLKKRVIM